MSHKRGMLRKDSTRDEVSKAMLKAVEEVWPGDYEESIRARVIELIYKDKPMRPIRNTNAADGIETDDCPYCLKILRAYNKSNPRKSTGEVEPMYCRFCGQRLDWEGRYNR